MVTCPEATDSGWLIRCHELGYLIFGRRACFAHCRVPPVNAKTVHLEKKSCCPDPEDAIGQHGHRCTEKQLHANRRLLHPSVVLVARCNFTRHYL